MKNSNLIKFSIGILTVLIMTGCGSNQLGIPIETNKIVGYLKQKNTTDDKIYLIGTKNTTSDSLSRASDMEESAYLTLQHTAELTLKSGNKYFAIYAPKMMSNYAGSTISSMEEFEAKCGTSILGGFGSAFDKFGLNTYYCNISGVRIVHTGFVEASFFKRKPLDILVWDARAVIDYLKKEDMYKDYDKDDMITPSSAHIGGGGFWKNKLKDAI